MPLPLRRVMAIPYEKDVHCLHFEKEGGDILILYIYIYLLYILYCVYAVYLQSTYSVYTKAASTVNIYVCKWIIHEYKFIGKAWWSPPPKCEGDIHFHFQVEGGAHPPLQEGMAITLLKGKGMVVTSSTLRRRAAISFTSIYKYFCVLYTCYNIYQSEGMATSHQSEGDGPPWSLTFSKRRKWPACLSHQEGWWPLPQGEGDLHPLQLRKENGYSLHM